jgi:hypothetical protein
MCARWAEAKTRPLSDAVLALSQECPSTWEIARISDPKSAQLRSDRSILDQVTRGSGNPQSDRSSSARGIVRTIRSSGQVVSGSSTHKGLGVLNDPRTNDRCNVALGDDPCCVRPHFREFRGLIVNQSLDVDLQLSVQLAAGESPTGYVDAIRIAELAAMGAGLDIQLRSRE